MKIFKIFIFLILSFLILFVFSCQKAENDVPGSKIIIADTTGDWGFPSPYGMYSRGPGYIRMSLIFDTLVWKDIGGTFIPALAKKWEYNNIDKSYTFSLREDVFWHDGNEFNADDVVFTFNYIKDNPWVWVDPEIIKEVEKINDFSIKVYLTEKYAPFVSNIAATLPIMPEHVWKNIAEPKQFKTEDALIGTGPYKLLDYSQGEGTYLFEANKNYYLGEPCYSQIAFTKNSQESIPSLLKANNLDTGPIPADTVESLKKDLNIKEEPPVWAAKLIFNHNSNDLLEINEIRKAIAYGINKEEIVNISQRGFATEGNPGLIPPTNKNWYNPGVKQYDFDINKAQEIIENLGFQLNQDGYYSKHKEELSFDLAVTQDFKRDGEILKSNLENIGIKINLYSYDPKTLDSKIAEWDFDLAISGHGGLGGDPEMLNKVIMGDNFISVRYFKNSELIDLLKKQVKEMDEQKRKELVFKIQEIYSEELPSITLYYPKWYWAHNDNIDIDFTNGGIAIGIPLPLNKILFLDRK